MNTPSTVSLVIGVIGLLAAAAMGVFLVTDDDDDGGTALGATEAGFVIEPAGEVGPDAFTPSVEIGGDTVCDKEQFLSELMSRPDAVREWARVLGIPESGVPAYVESLEPAVLTEDTAVTNHGLRDGTAYARPSMLETGTAVLMGVLPTSTVAIPPQSVSTVTTGPPETTITVPTTVPGEEIPITRCRCGNPLLPAYAPAGGEVTPTTTTTIEVPVAPPPDDDTPDDDLPPEDDSTPDEDLPPQEDLPPDDDVPPDQDTPNGAVQSP